jgi:hypothetical protein
MSSDHRPSCHGRVADPILVLLEVLLLFSHSQRTTGYNPKHHSQPTGTMTAATLWWMKTNPFNLSNNTSWRIIQTQTGNWILLPLALVRTSLFFHRSKTKSDGPEIYSFYLYAIKILWTNDDKIRSVDNAIST